MKELHVHYRIIILHHLFGYIFNQAVGMYFASLSAADQIEAMQTPVYSIIEGWLVVELRFYRCLVNEDLFFRIVTL